MLVEGDIPGYKYKNAAVIYITDTGKTLLIKLNYGNRLWVTPGGGIDPGEDTFTAAIREMYEETGLVFNDDCHEVIYDFTGVNKTKCYVIVGPEMEVTLSNEHTAYTYVLFDEVFDQVLTDYTYKTFEFLFENL